MAFRCDICGRGRQAGNNISHSNIKTKRVWRPNLHAARAKIDGRTQRIRACTRCLRGGRVIKAA
ncbi:MAG: 50S ribosomal protein L28 [Myxococcota bacterium]